MKSVLITGSAGFIGCHLAAHYLHKGYRVYGLDNYLTGSPQNTEWLHTLPGQFHFLNQDVSATWNVPEIQGLDYVFHLASPAAVKLYQKYSLETLQANSLGLQYALTFADKHKARLIFSSTSEIYGSPLTSPQKESDWGHVNPFGERSCYDEAKRFGEALIYSHNRIYGTTHGIVRIFNTYGPRMHPADDRVVNTFVKLALKNEDLVVYGNGTQTRSFCYIDDLIVGLTHYSESELCSPVNIGNDEEIKIIELAHLILELTGSKAKIHFEPLPEDDPPNRRPDLTLARQKLSYSPAHNLRTGLKKMITDNTQ